MQRPLCVQLVTINYLSNRTLESEKIQNTDLIFGYYLDALDETYSILAHIPYANQILYHIEIEKDFLSQNILAAVLHSTYSVHDSRVLVDAVQNQGFVLPEKKCIIYTYHMSAILIKSGKESNSIQKKIFTGAGTYID